MFFPWTSGTTDRAEISEINAVTQAYCDDCPVRDACLNFAVENGCQGIWGGVYISYRKAIRLQGMKNKPTSREEIRDLLKYEGESDEQ